MGNGSDFAPRDSAGACPFRGQVVRSTEPQTLSGEHVHVLRQADETPHDRIIGWWREQVEIFNGRRT